MLLIDIRGESLKYAITKKRLQKAEFELTIHKVEELEQKVHINPNDDILFEELCTARTRLEDMNKNIAEGAAVRSRARYCIDGEKPSRLFCSLEQKNGAQKFIPSLKVEVKDGDNVRLKEIREQKEIEKEVRNFYGDLYSNHDANIKVNSIEEFLEADFDSLPKFNNEECASMEGLLTLDEVTKYLKKTKNNA